MKNKLICPLLLLIVLAFVAGCKKTEDTPAPDLAATAAGTYVINSLTQATTTVAVPASSNYTVTLTRTSNNVVDMTLKTTTTGGIPAITLTGTPAAITFQKSYTVTGSSASGNATGDITNGTLTVNTVEGGVNYKIIAKK